MLPVRSTRKREEKDNADHCKFDWYQLRFPRLASGATVREGGAQMVMDAGFGFGVVGLLLLVVCTMAVLVGWE